MPELPDLEYVVPKLRESLLGKTVQEVRVKQPLVLRMTVSGDFCSLCSGQPLAKIERHGAFVVFALGPELELVVHPMLAGRFKLSSPRQKEERSLCFAFVFSEALELRYLDDKKMGKAYLIPRGEWARVPGLASLGMDIRSPAFTLEAFRSLAARRRDQVRVFLMDKTALSAIGNAYADEILFAAGIHPKTPCRLLGDADTEALYQAIRQVTEAAIEEIEARGEPTEVKVRDFLRVRNRKGQPCPRCGTKIRVAGVRGWDAFFCPQCQPARRPQFIDWGKLPAPDASSATDSTQR